ncbi:MAG: radical SAM protein [Candidatus Omnitrophica bacterium]|nr:radical SAM protein [Candidatus Omnitrophota bacterium]MCM8771106.1 radical SAM protein [Candidatus Omnitrophota bacterium]
MNAISQKAEQKLDLLNQKSLDRCIPLNAHFDLTYNCNLRCVHCYVTKDRKRRELDYAEVTELLDQLAQAGCLWLTLSGGEILTRPDFFDIAFYAKKKCFALRLFTNGTLIEIDTASKMAELSPLTIEISLYGASESTHETITQIKGSFKKTLKAIELLKKKGLRVILKTMLMKPNIDELENIFKLGRDLAVEHQFDVEICPKNDGSLEPTKYQLQDDDLLEYFLNDIPQRMEYEEEEPRDSALKKPVCFPGTNSCAISSYGDVYPCAIMLLNMGNIRNKKFKDIWYNETADLSILRLKRQYQHFPQCLNCTLISYCRRCHGKAMLFQGDFLKCDPLAYRLARIKKIVNATRKREVIWKENLTRQENSMKSQY